MKRIIALSLVILLIVPLLACHGSGGMKEFAMPEGFDDSRSYEITFWAKNDTNKTQVDIYKRAIEDFETIYPNVKVNLRLYTDYGKIYNDVITNISTATTPNVCITYPDHIATYLTGKNLVVPLESLMDDAEYGLGGEKVRFDAPKRDEMVEKYLDEGVINGLHYALPFMRSTEACYVNKTYVEKLGYTLPETLTWDFIFEVSEAAMAKDGDGNFLVNGQKVMIPFIYKSTDNMMIQYLKQSGAGYSDDEGDILLFNQTTKELLYKVAAHAGTRAFSTFKISSYPGNFLNAGQCIFGVDSTAGATWMGSKAGHQDISSDKLVDFELAVMTVPQADPEHPQMISQGPSLCIFNKDDPQEVLASWLFAQYLVSNSVQIAYAETEGYVPVTKKAQESEEYREYLSLAGTDNDLHYEVKIQAAELLLNNVDNTFITPVWVGSASLRDAAGALIENTAKSARRNELIDESYMSELFDDVNALYRLDQHDAENIGRKELGPLPSTAIWLIAVLGIFWLGIILAAVIRWIRKKDNS